MATIASMPRRPDTKTATDSIAGFRITGKRPKASDGMPKTPKEVGTTTRQNSGADSAGIPRLGRMRRPGERVTDSGATTSTASPRTMVTRCTT